MIDRSLQWMSTKLVLRVLLLFIFRQMAIVEGNRIKRVIAVMESEKNLFSRRSRLYYYPHDPIALKYVQMMMGFPHTKSSGMQLKKEEFRRKAQEARSQDAIFEDLADIPGTREYWISARIERECRHELSASLNPGATTLEREIKLLMESGKCKYQKLRELDEKLSERIPTR